MPSLYHVSSTVKWFCCTQDLIEDLRSELGGRFESTIIGLLTPRIEYDAVHIRKAIEVGGCQKTTENISLFVIYICCSYALLDLLYLGYIIYMCCHGNRAQAQMRMH